VNSLLEGTDTIKFGMTNEEIHNILGIEPPLQNNGVYIKEYYPRICKVFYTKDDNDKLRCSEIEFYNPVELYLDDIPIMGRPEKEIAQLFKDKFEDYSFDGMSGHRSNKYQIGFGVSDRKPHVVDAVVISREGYREEMDELSKDIVYTPSNEFICIQCKSTTTSETPIVKCIKCNTFMIPK